LTAIRNYSIFSDEITLGIFVVFWNGADPGIAEIKDAKKRVEG
jgi:L-rhamnose mutarotase